MAQNSLITSELLKQFVLMAAQSLEGDWVMIGGTVLPLLGISNRVTYDIDMVGPIESSTAQSLKLMEIAEQLGLAVESINQAGAYFYYKLKPSQTDLVLLEKSNQCRIYRPNLSLFIELKLARLSESDLSDCLLMISQLRKELSEGAAKKLQKVIESELSNEGLSPERKKRLGQLFKAINFE